MKGSRSQWPALSRLYYILHVQATPLWRKCGAPGILFRCFELAQLTEGGLGPATNLIESTVTQCVKYFYYIQALLSCLL